MTGRSMDGEALRKDIGRMDFDRSIAKAKG